MLYVFGGFYGVLIVYAAVIAWRGIESLLWLTDGDSPRKSRSFAIQLATVPFTVCLFAALLLDNMIGRGLAPDVSVGAERGFLGTLLFCVFSFVNSVCWDTFKSFGLELKSGVSFSPSLSFSSALIYSLNLFGSLLGISFLAVVVRFMRRQRPR
jgi:hypothetical protein